MQCCRLELRERFSALQFLGLFRFISPGDLLPPTQLSIGGKQGWRVFAGDRPARLGCQLPPVPHANLLVIDKQVQCVASQVQCAVADDALLGFDVAVVAHDPTGERVGVGCFADNFQHLHVRIGTRCVLPVFQLVKVQQIFGVWLA